MRNINNLLKIFIYVTTIICRNQKRTVHEKCFPESLAYFWGWGWEERVAANNNMLQLTNGIYQTLFSKMAIHF